MPYEYTLPLTGTVVQNVTYVGTTATTLSGITGTLNLSADTTLKTTLCTGGGFGTRYIFNFSVRPGPTGLTLSATSTDLLLTLPSSRGGTLVYGYVDSSTLNGTTSAFTLNVKFNDTNFLATTLQLSGIRGTCTFGPATQIDNPLVILNAPSVTTVYRGLSTTNSYFRTTSRQTRLVQGEY